MGQGGEGGVPGVDPGVGDGVPAQVEDEEAVAQPAQEGGGEARQGVVGEVQLAEGQAAVLL